MQRSGRVWRVIRTGLCVLFLLAALVQIGYSIAWMAGNFNTVPDFGDTKEYLSLSETFSLDEYRPVLYPLLLKWARGIDAEHYYHLKLPTLKITVEP